MSRWHLDSYLPTRTATLTEVTMFWSIYAIVAILAVAAAYAWLDRKYGA